MAESSMNENTCVVCFKNVEYYSIGECDHPVCYECSTRMRVLCLQNECPICRQALARVVFTETVKTYKELRNQVFSDRLFERQYKIGFCNDEIKAAYERVLEHRCKICHELPLFRSFNVLSDHMRKVHERHFCDLCVKHLKIFSSERKCYTRQELAHHRRKGDIDDTSHRGHPLCEFCEERFMDTDELYRHLRKEHLYCHLCDADGRNHYYASHTALAQHFRTEHYLCEEGECAGQHLTAVFRTEIDLKAHKANVHGKGLARAASRQARTLELQFNITPHPGMRSQPQSRSYNDSRQERREPSPIPIPDLSPVQNAARIDTGSVAEFPMLSTAAPAAVLVPGATIRQYQGGAGLARTDKNFPALDGSASKPGSSSAQTRPMAGPSVAATLRTNPKPGVSIQLQSKPASASNFRLTQASGHRISAPSPKKPINPKLYEDFPSLGTTNDDHPSLGAGTVQPPKIGLVNSQQMQSMKQQQTSFPAQKQKLHIEAFPALSSNAAPSTPPQWITVSKPKEKVKAKPVPSPPPSTPNFNPVADFPQLFVNSKSKKKTVQNVQPPQAKSYSQNDISNNKTKRDKDKKRLDITSIPSAPNGPVKANKNSKDILTALGDQNITETKIDTKISIVSPTTSDVAAKTNSKRANGDNYTVTPDDFPSLAVKGKPPGFEKVKPVNGTVQVPPGFVTRPKCDGLTFTNSAGQSFSAPLHSYIPPQNFEQRNRTLVKKFADALGGAGAVEDFKVASRAFRDNIITAPEFYAHCKSALGSKLEEVFPELVALLPDIGKQQELMVGLKGDLKLHTCKTCGQLLPECDLIAHETAHWPPLAPR